MNHKLLFLAALTVLLLDPATAAAATHQVCRGDTLGALAGKYGVTVEQLRKWNNLRSNTIYVGQQVKVSLPGDGLPPGLNQHRVSQGETLSSIARRYQVTVAQLKNWNRLDGDVIKPGQRLNLGPVKESPADDHYLVRPGDTLGNVARRYGVTISQLKTWNNLRSDRIIIGQRLKLSGSTEPADRTTGRVVTRTDYHTVRRGENLTGIARRYSVTVGELRRLNRLRGDTIYRGQRLAVKVRRIQRDTAPPRIDPQPIIRSEMLFHTVDDGETVESIAARYELNPDYIREINLLAPAEPLRKGQVLAVCPPEFSIDDALPAGPEDESPGPPGVKD